MSCLMTTYARAPLSFVRGEGCFLFSNHGDRYLDFTSGVGVLALGHVPRKLLSVLREQGEKLWHVSNLFDVPEAERLARKLCGTCFGEQVFFCNSGAEAVEGALKLSRRHHDRRCSEGPADSQGRSRFLVFSGAFHGRTCATLAAGGNPRHQAGFAPLVPWFDRAEFDNLDSARAQVDRRTAAILVEPIQGEGGIRVARKSFLRGLRDLADATGALLIVDEVQCGMGRCGSFFAHQQVGVEPDILVLAKGLGGGFPIGAFLARREVAAGFSPGTHGSTFGGNPLAMRIAEAVVDEISSPGFLEAVRHRAAALDSGLRDLVATWPSVFPEARGLGLMRGLRSSPPVNEVLTWLREAKLLAVSAQENVLRLLPALIVSHEQIAEALDILASCARAFSRKGKRRT